MDNQDSNKKKPSKNSRKKNDNISSLDRSQINELLAESLTSYVKKVNKENKDIEDAVDRINTYLLEYLQAFILFGYDMKGEPISIHSASNQMDADALNSLINRALFKGLE